VSGAAAIMFPCSCRPGTRQRARVCASNVKQIAQGMLMYAADNDDVLPGDDCVDGPDRRLHPPATRSSHVLRCLRDSPGSYGYAMDRALSRKNRSKIVRPHGAFPCSSIPRSWSGTPPSGLGDSAGSGTPRRPELDRLCGRPCRACAPRPYAVDDWSSPARRTRRSTPGAFCNPHGSNTRARSGNGKPNDQQHDTIIGVCRYGRRADERVFCREQKATAWWPTSSRSSRSC